MPKILGMGDIGADPVDGTTKSSAEAQQRIVVDHVRPSEESLEAGSMSAPKPVQRRNVSLDSGYAPFETLFQEFEFEAVPFYNFWVEDEETNDREERGNRKLEDVPRFVKLAWNVAPDLTSGRSSLSSFGARAIDVKEGFSVGAAASRGFTVGGMQFSPAHLKTDNISHAVSSLANGHIAAGVIESVVELHDSSTDRSPEPEFDLVDEDDYLFDQQHWGIPFSEFNAMLWNRKSSVYGSQQNVFGRAMSVDSARDRKSFVDGQFGFSPQSVRGGTAQMKSAGTADLPVSHRGRVAQVTRKSPTDRVNEILAGIQESDGYVNDADPDAEYHAVNVKFTHVGLTGLVGESRIGSISRPEHADSVIALGPQITNLMAYSEAGFDHVERQVNIPSFSAPAGLPSLEYVGYVIEKYELKKGLSFQLVETIPIGGRDFSEYIDTKVKYGSVYRYRIRSILRWARPRNSPVIETDQTVIDQVSSINSIAPAQVSFFAGEWSKNWAHADVRDVEPPDPPDELTVTSDSRNKQIVVTVKLPYNPQRDISKITIVRRTLDSSGRPTSDWTTVKELDSEYRQGTRQVVIDESVHPSDDTTGTKLIVNQTTVAQDFVEFAPVNSRYVDTSVEYYQKSGVRYVYSAVCHTRHGESSVLADQLGARLNEDWKRTGEFSIDFVSSAGVDPDYSQGIFSTRPESRYRSEVIFFPERSGSFKLPGAVTFKGQERKGKRSLQDSSYVARIESLDNGQVVDVPVSVTFVSAPTKTFTTGDFLLPKSGR